MLMCLKCALPYRMKSISVYHDVEAYMNENHKFCKREPGMGLKGGGYEELDPESCKEIAAALNKMQEFINKWTNHLFDVTLSNSCPGDESINEHMPNALTINEMLPRFRASKTNGFSLKEPIFHEILQKCKLVVEGVQSHSKYCSLDRSLYTELTPLYEIHLRLVEDIVMEKDSIFKEPTFLPSFRSTPVQIPILPKHSTPGMKYLLFLCFFGTVWQD
jgi:hypothetical protein